MDAYKAFLAGLACAGGMLLVLVIALLMKWAFEPDCKAQPHLLVCKLEAAR